MPHVTLDLSTAKLEVKAAIVASALRAIADDLDAMRERLAAVDRQPLPDCTEPSKD